MKVAGKRLPEVLYSAVGLADRQTSTGASSLAVVPDSPRPTPWRVDLTSRFLQFGVLENQCGQSYLAVPIAAAVALQFGSVFTLLFLPPFPPPEKL